MIHNIRDTNGNLTISLKELYTMTYEEGKAYYQVGANYLFGNEILRLQDISNDLYIFVSNEGTHIVVNAFAIGIYLPSIASQGMAITKLD